MKKLLSEEGLTLSWTTTLYLHLNMMLCAKVFNRIIACKRKSSSLSSYFFVAALTSGFLISELS